MQTIEDIKLLLEQFNLTDDGIYYHINTLKRWNHPFTNLEVYVDRYNTNEINVTWEVTETAYGDKLIFSYTYTEHGVWREPTESLRISDYSDGTLFFSYFPEGNYSAENQLKANIIATNLNINYRRIERIIKFISNYSGNLDSLDIYHKNKPLINSDIIIGTLDIIPEQSRITMSLDLNTDTFITYVDDYYWRSIDDFLEYMSEAQTKRIPG